MNELMKIDDVQKFIKSHSFTFLYISRTNCSVCHALLPKVNTLLDEFPDVKRGYVNADHVPEIAGFLSVFTVPALLVFIEGKEVIREARFVQMNALRNQLEKVYRLAQ